jgi:hypothetical protein
MRKLVLVAIVLALPGCADETATPAAPASPGHRLVTLAPATGFAADSFAMSLQVLSPDSLRACVAKKQQIQQDDSAYAQEDIDVSARRAALDARSANINSSRRDVTGTSRAAVEAFNAKLRNLQSDMNRFNTDVSASNARRRGHGALVIAFNTDCAGHSYYNDDMETVLKDFPGLKLD